MRNAALALFAVAVSGCGTPYELQQAVVYDPANPYGVYDVYQPLGDEARTGRPALIAIHGGGWMMGDRSWGREIAHEFCPRGYVVIAPSYHLTVGPDRAPWPAQIEDVQAALRHVRASWKTLRIDPDRIASIGVSAGGHLATMLALRDDRHGPDGRVRVAVDLSGAQDLTQPGRSVMSTFDDVVTRALDHGPPWSQAELRDISPVWFARPDVSLLAVHGLTDTDVFVANAGWIAAALRARGARVDTYIVEGPSDDCHNECWKLPGPQTAVTRFLEDQLR